MANTPNELLYMGSHYTQPAKKATLQELTDYYRLCGVSRHHKHCLRCGKEADREHRTNWLTRCKAHCACCSVGVSPAVRPRHVGTHCPRMVMTYGGFFTPRSFGEHAGIAAQLGSPEFRELYDQRQGQVSGTVSGAGDRGRTLLSLGHAQQSNLRVDRKDEEADTKGNFDERRKKRDHSGSPINGPAKRSRWTCDDCGLEGHRVFQCPTTKCHKCRRLGHWAEKCGIVCTICNGRHHSVQDCPLMRTCGLCGQTGHGPANCAIPLPGRQMGTPRVKQEAQFEPSPGKDKKTDIHHREKMAQELEQTKRLLATSKQEKDLAQTQAARLQAELTSLRVKGLRAQIDTASLVAGLKAKIDDLEREVESLRAQIKASTARETEMAAREARLGDLERYL